MTALDYFSRTVGLDDSFIQTVDDCLCEWHKNPKNADEALRQIENARQTTGRLRRRLDAQRRQK